MKIVIKFFCMWLWSSYSFSQSVNYCLLNRFDEEIFSNASIQNNIQFGSNTDAYGNNIILTLDVYQPDGDTMIERPLIIWAHGGSFLSGTKNDIDVSQLSNHFALRGYVCASINYRLGIPFPVNQQSAMSAVYRAVQDMKAAVRFFRKDAATLNQYNINPNMIFAGGSSAGAFTALHLAYMNTYAELPSVIDTTLLGHLEGNSGNPGYSSEVNAVINLCGALGDKSWIQPGDIPFVSMHGTVDDVVPYSTAMIYILGSFPIMIVDGSYSISEHASIQGVNNEMFTYYHAGHVPYVSNVSYMDTTIRFVSNFLYRHFGCQPSDPTPVANTFPPAAIDDISSDQIDFFPNPSSGKIRINGDNELKEVTMYDIKGRIIFQEKIISNMLNLSHLSPGMYFVQFKTSNHHFAVRKLIIER